VPDIHTQRMSLYRMTATTMSQDANVQDKQRLSASTKMPKKNNLGFYSMT